MYANQIATLARMEKETRKAMRAAEDAGLNKLATAWNRAKAAMKRHISYQYHLAFGRKTWNFADAKSSGTLLRIEMAVSQELDYFRTFAIKHFSQHSVKTYNEEKRRAAWMLDQATPPGVNVAMNVAPIREAALSGQVQVFTGEAAINRVTDRLGAWLQAYQNALMQNITLGALNDSLPGDAMDEVEATRPGSPSADMSDALDRLWTTTMIDMEALARGEFADDNMDLLAAQIWQTMEDASVCEICDPNDGLEISDVDDDIPAHPNCRCYWRLVPRAWLDLMRDGDPELASVMADRDVDERSMFIRSPETGNPTAFLTLSFQEWNKEQEEARRAIRMGL